MTYILAIVVTIFNYSSNGSMMVERRHHSYENLSKESCHGLREMLIGEEIFQNPGGLENTKIITKGSCISR